MSEEFPTARLLGTHFHLPRPEQAVTAILARRESGYVCFANVHVVMEARDHQDFHDVLASAWQVYPDGKPIAFACRLHGYPAHQVRGPSISEAICARAAADGIPIGLYGGRPEVLAELQRILPQRHPGLQIAYAWSPPFRSLTADEQTAAVRAIRESGAQILLVGLGCPKQERWMREVSSELPIPLLGVGAWFDFASGSVREAPPWMRAAGLEWLHRLAQDPRRLGKRYAVHNPRYCWLVLASLLRHAIYRSRVPGK